jgi:3-oxoacyl-[acyl-carrier protein] reductase
MFEALEQRPCPFVQPRHPAEGSRYHPPVSGPDVRKFADFGVGDEASLEHVVRVEDVDRFVALTGDDNPVHVDDSYAAGLGVGGRVVHGMLTAGYVSTVIGTLLPGPGALWLSQRFNFRAPVRIGDRIEVRVRVRHLSPGTRVLVLDVVVANQHGKIVLDGEAQVQVLERVDEMGEPRGAVETVVVTGSGRGIGAAIARRLATDGVRVVLNYRTDDTGAQATLSSIRDSGGDATLYRADVSDPEGVAALMDHAVATYGHVDAVVNNAGGPPDPRPLSETTWEDMERHLGTHLRGSFLCVKAVLPAMIERGYGRIVNVTSQAAYGTPPPKQTGYVVAKAALAAFTRSVALEAGPHGVTVNAIAPGMVDTELVADVSPRIKMALAAQVPLRRLGLAADVADVASFLLGPGGSYVTGQTIHLSGGQVMT